MGGLRTDGSHHLHRILLHYCQQKGERRLHADRMKVREDSTARDVFLHRRSHRLRHGINTLAFRPRLVVRYCVDVHLVDVPVHRLRPDA